MSELIFIDKNKIDIQIPDELLKGKRHLTAAEISVLTDNLNSSDDPKWQNVYVDDSKFGFDPFLVKNSHFAGWVILGRIWPAKLRYHDLELETGIYKSYLRNVFTGNDNVIRNTAYLENYRIGNRVILFNIQEMSCTLHSKFGNGILKEGEPEHNRIFIDSGNEGGGRSILPFESMICADAYFWAQYRADKELLSRFKELTEKNNTKKLNTFGVVGDDAVIKNTSLIKDTKIGDAAYIKGAFKIKNVTICSTADEVSQIGEGVELVNGIIGAGSRIFYQAIGVRFVIGRNCQLKYGARLINSVLGDNSTVSCCELLNNLIFPFHEQHHNSSFLIAATVMGQSNIAAGATIGSNHNSRSPDGEIIAKRGFWAGLCTNFKHNSKFASFTLAAKGAYRFELNIEYPFSLISEGKEADKRISITPAWLFMYNMFAVMRNKYKFKARDKRLIKIQNIETDPLAPDTMQEIIFAIEKIIYLTCKKINLSKEGLEKQDLQKMKETAEKFLQENTDFSLYDPEAKKKYGAVILKPSKAYFTYIKILKYFALSSLIEYCNIRNYNHLSKEIFEEIKQIPLFTNWINAGGQIIPQKEAERLFLNIKNKTIDSWEEVHDFYNEVQKKYTDYKARYSLYILEYLSSSYDEQFEEKKHQLVKDVIEISNGIYESAFSSRKKDFTDFFRTITYANQSEAEAVLGTLESVSFLNELAKETKEFNSKAESLFKDA